MFYRLLDYNIADESVAETVLMIDLADYHAHNYDPVAIATHFQVRNHPLPCHI